MAETPNTVHGRLLEAVHIAGYTFERAFAELDFLLDDDRWKSVGDGFTDINAFLATIDFSEFRIAIEQRKKLAKRLHAIEASQRATARLIGVDPETVRRDLGRTGPANAASVEGDLENGEEIGVVGEASAANAATTPAWFQSDADPSKEAKRIARNQEREIEREQTRADRPPRPLPVGRFSLLLADPPWQYEHVKTESRAIENQYPTMSLAEICALTVPAADDCVLFLWATSPKLAEAMFVVESWGFTYRTCAVWDKDAIGMGYYFRQQHEILLVAARGSLPVPDPSARVSSVIRSRRGAHSEKPEIVYTVLESMYPQFDERDRVELFGRRARPGWSLWSNEPAVAS